MSSSAPKPKNPLKPYYPSETPDIPGNGPVATFSGRLPLPSGYNETVGVGNREKGGNIVHSVPRH